MQGIMEELAAGHITWATGSIFCLAALTTGAIGGAVGGILVGGKHIGYGLAAMMGTFFGPIAALPGVLIALIALLFSGSCGSSPDRAGPDRAGPVHTAPERAGPERAV